MSARGQYQYSPDVLISGEQFGLGGSGSVRGTAIERPLSADKGVAGSLEVSTPELAPGLRLFGFADAGWLWNNNPNGATKPSTDRLASLGVGRALRQRPAGRVHRVRPPGHRQPGAAGRERGRRRSAATTSST